MVKNKKIFLTILFVSISILVVAIIGFSISYAAYRNSLKAQRTIAPYDNSGARFSSNLLVNRDDNYKVVYTTSELVPPKETVTVCNYQQGRHTLYFGQNITYSVTLSVKRSDYTTPASASDFVDGETISFGDTVLSSTNLTATISGLVLTGGQTSSDAFDVEFSKYDSDLVLYVEVIPDHNLPHLKGFFEPALRAQGAMSSWVGSFSDDTSKPTTSYYGYNYVISGYGNGTIELSWNNTIIDLSYQTINEYDLGTVTVDGTTSSVTFDVSSDVLSRYDFNFYIVSAEAIEDTSWSLEEYNQMVDGESNYVVEIEFTQGE